MDVFSYFSGFARSAVPAQWITISCNNQFQLQIKTNMTDMFRTKESYPLPPLSLLDKSYTREEEEIEIKTTADKIADTLLSFGVDAIITDINRGPVYTRYELKPGRKVRVREIANLLDEIKLRVAAKEISIKAPIPGKSTIGIDVLTRTPK